MDIPTLLCKILLRASERQKATVFTDLILYYRLLLVISDFGLILHTLIKQSSETPDEATSLVAPDSADLQQKDLSSAARIIFYISTESTSQVVIFFVKQ